MRKSTTIQDIIHDVMNLRIKNPRKEIREMKTVSPRMLGSRLKKSVSFSSHVTVHTIDQDQCTEKKLIMCGNFCIV